MAELDKITGVDGKFINWSDIFDSAWDSLELCEAGVVSDRFLIGHWGNLSVLHDTFCNCLDLWSLGLWIPN